MPIANADNITEYDEFDLQLIVSGFSAQNPIAFDLVTSSQNTLDDLDLSNPKSSWMRAMSQLSVATVGAYALTLPSGGFRLYRYLRWVSTGALADSMTFSVEGVARRRSF
ncbi:MAG: hypothetical protein HY909_18140 [Deltaproteobacteria bacterium]|nr:hypothetical protein [Deltaproteobacteria bacterium]